MKAFAISLLFFISIFVRLGAQPFVLLDTKYEHSSSIEVLVVSPDKKYMLSGDFSGYVYFWDLSNYTVIYKLKAHSALVSSIQFNKDGTKFVTSGYDSKIKVWDYASKTLLKTVISPFPNNNFGVLSPDDSYIYYAGHKEETSFFETGDTYSALRKAQYSNPSNQKELFVHKSKTGLEYNFTDGIMDSEYKNLIFASGFSAYIWDVSKDDFVQTLHTGYYVNNVTSIPNSILAWADGKMLRWDWDGSRYAFEKLITCGDADETGYSRIVPTSDYKMIVSGNDGNLVNIYDLESLSLQQVLSGHSDVVRAFAFVNNDTILITGGYDNALKIWSFPAPVDTTEEIVIEPADTIVPVIEDTLIVEEKIDTSVKFNEENIPLSVKNRPVQKQGDFVVSSEDIEILVWDNSKLDGDSISLNINGVWVLENYLVVKEKKSLTIKIKPTTNNYLILYAHNIGSIPPNTATVAVRSGGVEQTLTLQSDLKKCGALNFSYKP